MPREIRASRVTVRSSRSLFASTLALALLALASSCVPSQTIEDLRYEYEVLRDDHE